MPTFNSQVYYGFTGNLSSFTLKGEEKKIPDFDSVFSALQASEEALGQKITQDNAETFRLQSAINDSGFTELDGAATLPEVIVQLNLVINFLNSQLIDARKNRG